MAFLARVSRAVATAVARPRPVQLSTAVRAMSAKPSVESGNIPSDVGGLTGRARDEALYQQAYGESIYDRDANAFFEEGTRENPIPILSEQDERIVGITLPDDSETRWFTMKAGELAYDPSTQNYFALKIVTKADVQVWLDKAEKDAH